MVANLKPAETDKRTQLIIERKTYQSFLDGCEVKSQSIEQQIIKAKQAQDIAVKAIMFDESIKNQQLLDDAQTLLGEVRKQESQLYLKRQEALKQISLIDEELILLDKAVTDEGKLLLIQKANDLLLKNKNKLLPLLAEFLTLQAIIQGDITLTNRLDITILLKKNFERDELLLSVENFKSLLRIKHNLSGVL